MKKRAVTLLLCLVLVVLSLLRGFAASAAGIIPATKTDFDVPCAAAILIDEDSGTVLYEKNADARRPIASITKVMTLLLAFEALEAGKIHLDDFVPVSEHAYHMGGSQIWLEPGEQMTLDDMLKAICVVSANDCCAAMAEYLAGSVESFVARMNEKASALGMDDTQFVDCSGLSDDGYSSAYDVALMSQALMQYSDITRYTTIWMDSIRDGAFQLANTNKLIRFYDGATGLKTGSTNAAGYCISATAERDGMELIAVILKGKTSPERFADAQTLLNYGFASYALKTVIPDEPLPPVPVTLGTQATVQPVLGEENQLLLEKAKAGSLQQLVTLADSVEAPVAAGSQLGTLTITSGEEVVAELPILAGEEIPRVTFGQMLVQMLRTAFLCG